MSTTLKIEDYLARGELRHFRTNEHRRIAARRKAPLRPSALLNEPSNDVAIDCEFARSQGLDDATIGDPFSDSEEGGERQRDQPLPDRMARASSKRRSFPPQSSSGRKKRKVLASLINSPAEAAHNELFEPLTDGHDEMPAEEHSDFTEDLIEDRHFRLQDDDENCNGSDHDSKVSAGDNNTQPCRQSSQMELELDEAALQDYNDYAHSGADDEEARAYNLIDRGLATVPDMKHLEEVVKLLLRPLWRGLQIVLARSIGDFSRGAQLDPSSERKLDKKTLKHFFRPYAKAVVALPRLCKFYKAAQGAVEKLVREEGLLNAQLARASKLYRRTATDALTHAKADARKDYHVQRPYCPTP
ncbi:BQ5605_C013g07142 [Microbotryum silenes-dioicae]|uniref:BQ5605_C013g07142 protein n=1 Tax=Microbotryum silenes-dioicae TaxID=796604 RepID=A0A2X0LR05_9BASI|nr:BQ5605_C013g07142 [Microbotryum silenes-dioicae]